MHVLLLRIYYICISSLTLVLRVDWLQTAGNARECAFDALRPSVFMLCVCACVVGGNDRKPYRRTRLLTRRAAKPTVTEKYDVLAKILSYV